MLYRRVMRIPPLLEVTAPLVGAALTPANPEVTGLAGPTGGNPR
jgi:hypothetical protein